MKTNIKKLAKSELEIEGEIPAEILESFYSKALMKIGGNLELPGFRKGKAPEKVLLQNVPEMKILEEMAELALSEHYPKIIEEEKIDPIGRPDISITKLARNNPLGFKIRLAVLPAIELPDYKKIARKVLGDIKPEEKNIEVTEEDLESTIMDIRKSRAPKVHMAEPARAEALEKTHSHKEGEEHDHEHPEPASAQGSGEVKPELPEFNDEFVNGLGPFENVADFRDKLRINLKLEKENAQKEKTRVKIIEKIIEESKMDVPELLVNLELDKILYRMESDIAQMGLKFEDYLAHLKKTKEDLRKDFHADAEKKAKLSLILNEIAKAENIKANPEQVAKEVTAILEHYKDADPERAQMHAENVLVNEKIFQFLESQ